MEKYDYIRAKKWLDLILHGIDLAIRYDDPKLLSTIGKRDGLTALLNELSGYVLNNDLQHDVASQVEEAKRLKDLLHDHWGYGRQDTQIPMERNITLNMVFNIINEWQLPCSTTSSEHEELADLLPEHLRTDRVVEILQRAIDAKMIVKTATGLKWLQIGGRGGKSQLAYYGGKLYGYKYSVYGNNGGRVNYEGLEKLFGVTRLDRALREAYDVKKPQWWRKKIDAIFE